MELAPTRQFYPATSFVDSLHSSVSNLHVTTRFHLFRCNSFIPSKRYCLYTSTTSSSFNLTPKGNPHLVPKSMKKKWVFPGETPDSSTNSSVNLSSGSRLDKWNETQNPNRPKWPEAVLSYRNSGNVSSSDCEEGSSTSTSGSTMDRIVEKLKEFGYIDDVDGKEAKVWERVIERGSVEDSFYVKEGMLPDPRGGFSGKSILPEGRVFKTGKEVVCPWEKPSENENEHKYSVRRKSRTSLAELTLPASELRRLRIMALRIKNKKRIGGAGVTQEIVNAIRDKWKSSEVVRLNIEGAPALNMRRMHEILERKTGGLVIWRSGTSVVLYRGVSYGVPLERHRKQIYNRNKIPSKSSVSTEKTNKLTSEDMTIISVQAPQVDTPSSAEEIRNSGLLPEMKYEDEVDKLLDDLGPRYTDWPGCNPLPVDADLLPGIVPGYKPPFRILPYGVRSSLGRKESTALRRLARVLPPHFALGRSRQHEGLAVAMIKLWERSLVAKVALKRGVQLTASERMAEDIKRLTGGMLLSRNKDFLVFYRGKDFLSPDVAEALLEKERLARAFQEEEEQARLRASVIISPSAEPTDESRTAGTLLETMDADARWGKRLDDDYREKIMKEAEVARHAKLVAKIEKKLAFAERKLMKAEMSLSKVESFLNPTQRPVDPESITDEERFMFRKLGLRTKAFLLLGRRGVFDGTVENMHLHWKYRELVKIILKAKNFEQVKKIALSLEAESGGVLVSVDRVSKGYAIIVFRGKDYKRPRALRPKNLLTKRKALARSIEIQRREALLNHISTLETRVGNLRSEIEEMAKVKERGDKELYDKLDCAYPTEDEISEDEGDEAYLETYNSDDNVENQSDNLIQNIELETDFSDDSWDQDTEKEPESHTAVVVANGLCIEDDGTGEAAASCPLNYEGEEFGGLISAESADC